MPYDDAGCWIDNAYGCQCDSPDVWIYSDAQVEYAEICSACGLEVGTDGWSGTWI